MSWNKTTCGILHEQRLRSYVSQEKRELCHLPGLPSACERNSGKRQMLLMYLHPLRAVHDQSCKRKEQAEGQLRGKGDNRSFRMNAYSASDGVDDKFAASLDLSSIDGSVGSHLDDESLDSLVAECGRKRRCRIGRRSSP